MSMTKEQAAEAISGMDRGQIAALLTQALTGSDPDEGDDSRAAEDAEIDAKVKRKGDGKGKGSKKKPNPNRMLSADDVLERLRKDPTGREILLNCDEYEIKGAWTWLYFNDKPSKEWRSTLSDLGFRFNRRRTENDPKVDGRSLWQHPGGKVKTGPARTSWDPAEKYGSITVDVNDDDS